MMHLEAIKRRNAKPAPQPTKTETNTVRHDHKVNRATHKPVRPWDTPMYRPAALGLGQAYAEGMRRHFPSKP